MVAETISDAKKSKWRKRGGERSFIMLLVIYKENFLLVEKRHKVCWPPQNHLLPTGSRAQ